MKPGRRPVPDAIYAAAVVAAAVALFLAPVLLRGRGLFPAGALALYAPWSRYFPPGRGALWSDPVLEFWPWRLFLRAQILSGRLPLWNPLIEAGVPFAGCAQAAMFFPTEIGLAWLPAAAWSMASAFLKLAAAGIFTALHARRLGAGRTGAALAGVVFALSGFMIAWLGHPQTNVACLLPALFWTLGRAVDAPSARRWAASSLVVGLIFLGGHPPTALHVLGAGAAYALFLSWPKPAPLRRSLLTSAGISTLLGAGLAAPALLPYAEYLKFSSTAAAAAALARWRFHLPWSLPLHLILPLSAGTATNSDPVLQAAFGLDFSSNFLERAGWVGIPALMLAALAVRRGWEKRETRFHLALAVFGLAAAVGLPPLPWIWRLVPGLSAANPTRLLLMFCFGAATLAGLGADAPELGDERRLAAAALGVALAFAAACAFVYGAVWSLLPAAARGFCAGQLVMALVEIAAAAALVVRPRARRWAPLIAAAFLMRLDWGVNPSAPQAALYPVTPGIAALAQAAGSDRMIALGSALPADVGMVWGLRDARGQDFTTPSRYERLVRGGVGDFGFFGSAESIPASRRLLAITAFAAASEAAPAAVPGWTLVHDGALRVFRADAPAPRALFVPEALSVPSESAWRLARDPRFDPARAVLLDDWFTPPSAPRSRGSARIVYDSPGRVDVEADGDGPGWIVLLDSWFPGWRVTVNGAPASLRRADYCFRAVAVPAGRSTASFRYVPYSFYTGLLIALASAAALALRWRRAGSA